MSAAAHPCPRGVWPVMLTPFAGDRSIDWPGVDALVEMYLAAGVAGLFAVAQSAEMFQLTEDERVALAARVVKRVGGRVPVVAGGAFAPTPERQVAMVRRLGDTGVAAVVLLTNQLADDGEGDDVWRARAEALLAATEGIDLGLYECPAPYKRILPADTLDRAAATGRFVFHKDTCLVGDQIAAKIAAVRGTRLRFFNAEMASLLASLEAGGGWVRRHRQQLLPRGHRLALPPRARPSRRGAPCPRPAHGGRTGGRLQVPGGGQALLAVEWPSGDRRDLPRPRGGVQRARRPWAARARPAHGRACGGRHRGGHGGVNDTGAEPNPVRGAPPSFPPLTTDEQRFDSLRAYGFEAGHQPHLDGLAADGATFERCYATNPICSPSRASLLTGHHLPEHGVYRLCDVLPDDEVLFPERLRDLGYQTALVGKLHVSSMHAEAEARHPHDGFDVYEWCNEGCVRMDPNVPRLRPLAGRGRSGVQAPPRDRGARRAAPSRAPTPEPLGRGAHDRLPAGARPGTPVLLPHEPVRPAQPVRGLPAARSGGHRRRPRPGGRRPVGQTGGAPA